ncbi:IS5 family transposase [Streptomyces longwoodensis]|uniref:IS5 family transposase n=1 Tax=Streptomyces longwoodensis TaxID=68231 RepID=UPI0033CA2C02
MFKLCTGVPWRDLPERFGPWQTMHGRFARWAADGTFDRLLAAAQQGAEVDWLVALDSTIVRAHQHTTPKGARGTRARTLPRRTDQQDPPGLRRARPAAVLHGHGRHPQRLHPGRSGHRQDPRHPARTGTAPCPERVVADKGYSARSFRAYLRRRGIKATIPERVDQLAGRRRRRERPCGFDRTVYRRRNVVERCGPAAARRGAAGRVRRGVRRRRGDHPGAARRPRAGPDRTRAAGAGGIPVRDRRTSCGTGRGAACAGHGRAPLDQGRGRTRRVRPAVARGGGSRVPTDGGLGRQPHRRRAGTRAGAVHGRSRPGPARRTRRVHPPVSGPKCGSTGMGSPD